MAQEQSFSTIAHFYKHLHCINNTTMTTVLQQQAAELSKAFNAQIIPDINKDTVFMCRNIPDVQRIYEKVFRHLKKFFVMLGERVARSTMSPIDSNHLSLDQFISSFIKDYVDTRTCQFSDNEKEFVVKFDTIVINYFCEQFPAKFRILFALSGSVDLLTQQQLAQLQFALCVPLQFAPQPLTQQPVAL